MLLKSRGMAPDSPGPAISLHRGPHGSQIAATDGAKATATFTENPFYIVIIRT
jgi:hypothetical protein